MARKRNIQRLITVLIAVVAAAIFFFVRDNGNGVGNTALPEFDRNLTQIALTKHAECRMDCRQINEREIREIIEKGKLNVNKSGYDKEHKNYTYAFDGYSYQNQHIRVVVTPRKKDVLVITVIDLDVDWACACN